MIHANVKKGTEMKATKVKATTTNKQTVKELIAKCVARKTVRPDVKIDVKKSMSLVEASKFINVNMGRVGWMTRAVGGNRLVAQKIDGKLMITRTSLVAYKTHRDAYYAGSKKSK
jgi:hypothetical protein